MSWRASGIEGFEAEVRPRRTPFARLRPADRGLLFVYMTNRAVRWSYLLRGEPAAILDQAQRLIPIGYSQLWLFEAIHGSGRPPGGAPSRAPELLRQRAAPPTTLARADWERRLYVVLCEPRGSQPTSDVVSYHLEREEAITASQLYTGARRRRSVVGLMLADAYWH